MSHPVRLLLFAFVLAGTPASALTPAAAPTGKSAIELPSPAELPISDLLASAFVMDIDRETRKDIVGAFDGSRCDALKPVVDSTLEQDRDRLLANYLALVCAQTGGTLVEADAARARFVSAASRSELPSGEYFGEEVRRISTTLDALAFAAAAEYTILADYFEVAGAGRRLYYVLVVREPETGRQRTLRFDMSAFVARVMGAIAERLSPDAREIAEDSPAILFIQTIMSRPDAAASVRIGLARYLLTLQGHSLQTPRVREALASAVAAGGTYSRLSLGQSYLTDESDATAPAQAFAQFSAASQAGLAEADVVLSMLYAKGVGVAKDPAESARARERAEHALGKVRADALLASALLARGSRLYDEPAGNAKREEAARAGDARAQNEVGVACELRSGANLAECVPWYEKASAQGHAIATRNLAKAYEYGKGVAKDADKAAMLYEKAAAEGVLSADVDLGWMLERNHASTQDPERIVMLYRAGAEWGDAWGENNFGNSLRDGSGVAKDIGRGMRWLRLAAAQGNANACFTLGDAYEMGRGIAPDQAEAVMYYRCAVAAGNTAAMIRLASMAREGRGLEKDAGAANGLLERAVRLGDAEAMWRLGNAYVFGSGGVANRAIGLDWLRQSAAKQNERAPINLGVALLAGDSKSEHAEGAELLRKLALAGDAESMNALGYAYENGLGVAQSYGEAATWYRRSVDAGSDSGINNLARLQRAGLGMPKDAAQARALFEKASARGASDATCNLAGMLVAGEGGALDMQRGHVLMQQAADAGDASCALNLGIGYRYGDVGIDPDMHKARHYLQVAEEQHLDEATAQLTEMTMFEHEDDEQEVRAGFAVLTRLADAGGTRAKFLLGEACLLGRPWPRDPACARQRFREAGEQGFRAGASNLGLLLEAGIGGPVDLEGAEVWFRKAIDLGVGDSRYELGRLLLHKGRTKEALDNLVAVAGDGSRLPMYVVMRWCNAHPDCEVPAAKRAEFAKALADFPDDRRNVFAWGLAVDVMSDAEDGRHAVKLMESLAQTHAPGWPELDTLAAAQARAGDFDRAAATERKAIAMAPADLYRRTRRTLEERVTLYDARKTCDLPY